MKLGSTFYHRPTSRSCWIASHVWRQNGSRRVRVVFDDRSRRVVSVNDLVRFCATREETRLATALGLTALEVREARA